jgi:hypothetical protein
VWNAAGERVAGGVGVGGFDGGAFDGWDHGLHVVRVGRKFGNRDA